MTFGEEFGSAEKPPDSIKKTVSQPIEKVTEKPVIFILSSDSDSIFERESNGDEE